ncbi:triose-phosphate isomerase [Hippea maritima]|uniref:Triosephosphate isomerase n=1 Tax=Hippea maritima (strain ATCC 700847 / DSM 10411 / MH2) TaxID=760142 RepID=F2LX80_HIPMA|nr:triose-phosphate isomerase [Hippea maritima]AEA33138.1 triosephosphate isomerase [Hippea maritima DSM 10411]
MMRNIIAANWKMHFDLDSAIQVASQMKDDLSSFGKTEIIVCPSFVFLHPLANIFNESNIKLGAQNVYFEDKGAFTGEVSPSMLKSVGCEYVIIGHSERRHIFLESDIDIQKKVKKALEYNLKPILCVGETLSQRKEDKAFDVVERQIISALDGVDLNKVIIAYEPVWAIGTGVAADEATVGEMHNFLANLVEDVPILYGGSVKPENAFNLAKIDTVNGFLVGSASLDTGSLKRIIVEFEKAKGV